MLSLDRAYPWPHLSSLICFIWFSFIQLYTLWFHPSECFFFIMCLSSIHSWKYIHVYNEGYLMINTHWLIGSSEGSLWLHQHEFSYTLGDPAWLKASVILHSSQHASTSPTQLNTLLWVPRYVRTWSVKTSLGCTYLSTSIFFSPPWECSTHCAYVSEHLLNTLAHTMGDSTHVWVKSQKYHKCHILRWEFQNFLHINYGF